MKAAYLLRPLARQFGRRYFLSEAYACNEAWQNRLQEEPFPKLDPEAFIFEVKKRFQSVNGINAIDLDVALNLAKTAGHLDDLKQCIYRIRHCKAATSVLPSSHHAFVRTCLATNSDRVIMEVMSDPINYGIFPDAFAANLVIDHFIKSGQFTEAAIVSCEMMKQEEFRPSVCWLSAFSCLSWLLRADQLTWQKGEKATEEESLVDEMIFRVPFLKNPIADDHFDLQQPRLLVGKTLAWMCEQLPQQGSAVRSAYLVGLCLWGQENDAKSELRNIRSVGAKLCKDVLGLLETVFSKLSDEEKTASSAIIDFVQKDLKELPDDHFLQTSIEEEFLKEMNEHLPSLEKEDIESQLKLFAEWNRKRAVLMNAKIRLHALRKRLQEIEEHEERLRIEEDLLFFFENKSNWEQAASAKFQGVRDDTTADAGKTSSAEPYVVPQIKKRAEQHERKTF